MNEEVKKYLLNLGYSDEQIAAIDNKKKIYFQGDVDNIVEKAKNTEIEKINKNYIKKEEFDILNANYNNLNKQVKQDGIKQIFDKYGGKEGKVFDDFLKLNEDLLELDNDVLESKIKERTNEYGWAFQSSSELSSKNNFTPNSEKEIFSELINGEDGSLVEGTIYKNINK